MQKKAIAQMKEMQTKASPPAPPKPETPRPHVPTPQLPPAAQQPSKLQSLFSRFLHMENDTALIIPLLLLLSREGADDALLLALLYIMR